MHPGCNLPPRKPGGPSPAWLARLEADQMTTPQGLEFVLARLADAPDIHALRRVWLDLGRAYQRHPAVIRLKDDLKKGFENA